MTNRYYNAEKAHHLVPPDWYYESIKHNLFQRYWHKRRFEEVLKLTEKVGGNILDVGCADGVFTKNILDKAKPNKIEGIDVLDSSIKWAKKHWNNKKMRFSVMNAENLNFPRDSFDAVYILEVLEHVKNPFMVLKKVRVLLKKNGYGIFLVPTDSVLFRSIWFIWTKFRGKIWKETHIQSYKKNSLSRMCKKAGFKIEKDKKFILGMLQVVKVRK